MLMDVESTLNQMVFSPTSVVTSVHCLPCN